MSFDSHMISVRSQAVGVIMQGLASTRESWGGESLGVVHKVTELAITGMETQTEMLSPVGI